MYNPLILTVFLQATLYCVNTRVFNNTQGARIVNGEDAVEGEFPFVGVLISSSKFNPSLYTQRGQCGGSILSKRIILTAAHCVVIEQELQDSSTIYTITMPINMEFQAGIYKLDESPATERKYSLAGVVVHAEYDTFDLSNDIALVITKEDIEFNDNIKTISLPEQTDIAQLYAEGAPATVIGWGLTETGSLTTELKKLPYEVVSDSQCKEVYGASIKPGMMCTGRAPMTEKHAAPGDSGGPVFVKKAADDFVQIGLVSWGPEVSDQDTKTWDVNADVGYYLKWINDNMNALFTDYVTTTYAEDTPKSISYQNIRNFLFKTVTILPTDTSKYSTIIFKSGKMGRNDLVMVYDGSDISMDKQLAQLTGTISELTLTATTNKGLTVAIMTDSEGVSEGFTFDYKQVATQGGSTDLVCPSGYKACTDKYYCLNLELFCNSQEDSLGECRDGSDESLTNCKNNDNNPNNNTDTDPKPNGGDLALISTTLMLFNLFNFTRLFV